jgi:hypothetical protein
LVSYGAFQNYNFDGAFSYDFEKFNFEDKPLEEEEYLDLFKGSQEDENFHISNHSWDEDHWNLYGDPSMILIVNFLKITLNILRPLDHLILWMSWLKRVVNSEIFSLVLPCIVFNL